MSNCRHFENNQKKTQRLEPEPNERDSNDHYVRWPLSRYTCITYGVNKRPRHTRLSSAKVIEILLIVNRDSNRQWEYCMLTYPVCKFEMVFSETLGQNQIDADWIAHGNPMIMQREILFNTPFG